MNQGEFLEISRRQKEGIVVAFYSLYTLFMFTIAFFVHWPQWVIPTILYSCAIVWFCYIKKAYTYRLRSYLLALMCCFNFVIYGMYSNSFVGLLSTFGAMIVVLALLNIPEFLYLEIFFTLLLVVFHGLFKQTIPHGTILETIYSLIRIVSLLAIEFVTHYLVKTHQEMNLQLQEVIENLRSAESSKDDFLSNISHEIRTPINSISGMSEMILREELPGNIREDVLGIQTACRNLHSIVSNILDYTELEQGTVELVEEPYNLTSTINDVLNVAIARKENKAIELIVDCDAKIPSVLLGDEVKLRRVILNLLDNAIKFTEKGCVTLTITARPEEYGVNLCVKVKDTGIGLADEDEDKLFNRFAQKDSKRNRQTNGVGIGLAIAKRIINQMGGVIDVKSELGKGSEFQFVIPQKVVDEQPMVSVKNAEQLNIVCYINLEKFTFAEIRDDYLRNMRNMAHGLECGYQSCRNLSELKRRMDREIYTHVIITIDEYQEDPPYFEQLSKHITLIVIQDRDQMVELNSQICCIYKPIYILPIAAVLNGDRIPQQDNSVYRHENRFTAPMASVLIVDDNLTNLRIAEGLLSPYEVRVSSAASGKEALAKLNRMRFDIIFMDHMMPEMDGVETAHEIRKKPGAYFQKVPIVALTANVVGGAREMFINEGFQDYVPKPIEISQLERVLQKHLPQDKIIKKQSISFAQGKNRNYLPESNTHINRAKGLYYCGNDLNDYEEILSVYLKNGLQDSEKISHCFQKEDWKNYTILVHAVKSTSLGIGADHLGQLAKKLEDAGKRRDHSYIHQHHHEMMLEYRNVLEEIGGKTIPTTTQTEKTEIDRKTFSEYMQQLSDILNTFEKDSAEEKMQELSNFSVHGTNLEQLLQPVRMQVAQFDFLAASETVSELLKEGDNLHD